MKLSRYLLSISALLCVASRLSYGAGAYIVDDGGITEKNTLQIENWYNKSSDGRQFFVSNPTYQLLPNAEFAIQETYSNNDVEQNTLFPQIKYLWHNSKHNNKEINSSAVIGFNYKTNDGSGIYGSYFYVPTTIVMNKFLNLSFDLGLQRWNDVNNNTSFLIGGAALEFRVSEKSVLIAEIFRNSNKHSLQVGNKFSSSAITGGQFGLRNFYSKNFIFDVIYGKDIIGDGSSNWITGGLTILFE